MLHRSCVCGGFDSFHIRNPQPAQQSTAARGVIWGFTAAGMLCSFSEQQQNVNLQTDGGASFQHRLVFLCSFSEQQQEYLFSRLGCTY